jgi:hypothetical protein
MATFNTIGLAEPSTITKNLASITLTRNSSVTHQEILTVGDPETTNALARVTDASPQSTMFGMVTRVAGSTVAANYIPVRLVAASGSSFAEPAIDYVHDSTLTASTVQGPAVLLRASAAAPAAVSGDDRFVAQWGLRTGQAVVTIADSAGALAGTSSNAPSSNAVGLVVRPVVSGMQTYAASTTGQSSATTIASSQAGSKAYVYAYTITSTISGSAPQCGFYDGATLKWPVKLSSGFSGANLAVSPPAYLFSGSTGSPLTFNVADSNAGMTVGIAYWVST